MSQSQFSPETFLDMTIETVLEKREPLPVGDYQANIGDVTSRAWQSKDGSKSGIAWDVPLTITVPAEIQEALGLPSTLRVNDSIMIDINEQGGIDTSKGKNNRLRQYREACDMNKPGDSFSARKLSGQPLMVSIKHELYNGTILEKAGMVAKL